MVVKNSKLISNIEYVIDSQILKVKFVNSDKLYEFKNIPERIFFELCDADSRGQYFLKNIKGKYDYEIIESTDLVTQNEI